MAPVGTLWGYPTQRQTKVIRVTAAVAGLELTNAPVDWYVTLKSPEYLSKFPMGKIPAFEDSKGLKLFEGATIANYVASQAPESGLLGRNAGEAALVDQWIHFSESEISAFSYEIKALVAGFLGAYSKEIHDKNLGRQARGLKFLDEHLAASKSGYLISDELTLADITLASVIQQAGQITLGAAQRAEYPNIFAHYEKVTSYPGVKEVFGEAEFVEERLTPKPKDA